MIHEEHLSTARSCPTCIRRRKRYLHFTVFSAAATFALLGLPYRVWSYQPRAFQPWGVSYRDIRCAQGRPTSLTLQAKPKKGPKGLDAAKAAALAALEEIERQEAAASPVPRQPSAGTKDQVHDKKAARRAKREQEKAEAEEASAARSQDPGHQRQRGAEASAPRMAQSLSGESRTDLRGPSLAAAGTSSPPMEEDVAVRTMEEHGGRPDDMNLRIDSTNPLEQEDISRVRSAKDGSAYEAKLLQATEGQGREKRVSEKGETTSDETEQEVLQTLEQKVRSAKPPARVRITTDTANPGSAFVRMESVDVIFRDQEVVKDATWGVGTGERVGLVGPNGGGKTTQLKVLAGELEPTAGEVTKSSRDLSIAFLRQEFTDELVPDRSLKDEFLSVFRAEQATLSRLKGLEDALESAVADPDRMSKTLEELGEVQMTAERQGAYGLETRVEKVMGLMGFAPSDASLPVRAFSGGWKMRIGLGKVLLQEPGVLMLDEPTNHLDLDSVEWLEAFLKTQQLPMVIVSHDREFLDRVCTKIVDTDGGSCLSYTGNYSNFLKQKQARLEAWQKAYDLQQKKIQEDRDFINRFRTGSRASQAKSRETALEKFVSSDEFVRRPPAQGTALRFRFPFGPRLQGEVVAIERLRHGYGNDLLFDGADLTLQRGDRVALIGPNGSGKSTLLRLVMGLEKAQAGRAEITAPNAVANYFEQNQADALELDKTVDETVTEASSVESYNQLRALMAQFLFKGDAIQKKVSQLSGGEKARVALCKMMLKPGNLLCLDEPTNHLDIPAKEILEEACRNYPGAIMLVSHDRFFVSQVANRIVVVEDKKLTVYEGDYKDYMERNDEMREKVERRYVEGTTGIRAAPKVDLEAESPKKKFGGKGGPSGKVGKGVKNAKPYGRNADHESEEMAQARSA